jgi:hypothetical protein
VLGLLVVGFQIFERSVQELWLSGLLPSRTTSGSITFIFVIAITITFQAILLKLVSSVPATRKREGLLRSGLYFSIIVVQTVIIALLTLLSLQITFDRIYSVNLLEIIITISYVCSIIVTGMLIFRFIKSVLRSRSKVILTYMFALVAIALYFSVSLSYLLTQFNVRPEIITSFRDAYGAYFNPASPALSTGYALAGYGYFLLTWFATVLLLQYYSHRIGKVRYWLIASVPIIYFLGQFVTFALDNLNISRPFATSLTYNFIIFTFKAGGGVMFGFAFFILSRNIRTHDIQYYLLIAGLGIMFVFSSTDLSSIGFAPFPPFGIGSVSYLPLSTYLLFMGLDSCSRRLAFDSNIRRTIMDSVKEDELLKGLTGSQLEDSILHRVRYLQRNLAKYEEPRESSPLIHDENIAEYVQEVVHEVQKYKETEDK